MELLRDAGKNINVILVLLLQDCICIIRSSVGRDLLWEPDIDECCESALKEERGSLAWSVWGCFAKHSYSVVLQSLLCIYFTFDNCEGRRKGPWAHKASIALAAWKSGEFKLLKCYYLFWSAVLVIKITLSGNPGYCIHRSLSQCCSCDWGTQISKSEIKSFFVLSVSYGSVILISPKLARTTFPAGTEFWLPRALICLGVADSKTLCI